MYKHSNLEMGRLVCLKGYVDCYVDRILKHLLYTRFVSVLICYFYSKKLNTCIYIFQP